LNLNIHLGAIVVGIIFFIKNKLARGLAYPLLVIAVIELIVGGTVYLRTDEQMSSLINQFRTEPIVYINEEITRMSSVLAGFITFRILQISMAIIGLFLFLLAIIKKWATLQGAGIGLIVMGLVLLLMDLLGTLRAEVYLEALQKLAG